MEENHSDQLAFVRGALHAIVISAVCWAVIICSMWLMFG